MTQGTVWRASREEIKAQLKGRTEEVRPVITMPRATFEAALPKSPKGGKRPPTDSDIRRLLFGLAYWYGAEHPGVSLNIPEMLIDTPESARNWRLLACFFASKIRPDWFPDRKREGRPLVNPSSSPFAGLPITMENGMWLFRNVKTLREKQPGRGVLGACKDLKAGKGERCPTDYAKTHDPKIMAAHHRAVTTRIAKLQPKAGKSRQTSGST